MGKLTDVLRLWRIAKKVSALLIQTSFTQGKAVISEGKVLRIRVFYSYAAPETKWTVFTELRQSFVTQLTKLQGAKIVLTVEELYEKESEQRGFGGTTRNLLEGWTQPCPDWTDLVGRSIFCMTGLWVITNDSQGARLGTETLLGLTADPVYVMKMSAVPSCSAFLTSVNVCYCLKVTIFVGIKCVCVCVCVCVCMYVCMYVCITFIRMYICMCMYLCMCVRTYVRIYVCIIYVCTYLCMCMYMCMYVCLCLSVCVQYTKYRLWKGTYLGAITKLRQATIGFVMPFRPPVLSTWKNSAPTGQIIMKFNIWVLFEHRLRKLKFR